MMVEKGSEKGIQDIRSKAARLADLVDYRPGAIVSRTLIDKKAGTITLFAFDAGQGLSEHTAPFDAFVQIVDGEAEITISQKTVKASAGEILIMSAGETHSLRAARPFKMLLTMVRS